MYRGGATLRLLGEREPEKPAPVRPPVLPKPRSCHLQGPSALVPPTGPGLTTVVLRVQGFPTAQEGVEQERPVVHSQTQVAWLGLRTSGQVGAKRCHGDELHQLHVRHVTKATIIGVNASHLERAREDPVPSEPGKKSRRGIYCSQFPDHGGKWSQCSQDRPPPCTYPLAFLRSMPAGHTTLSPPSSRSKTLFSLLYGLC
jgi:hypothetical protein